MSFYLNYRQTATCKASARHIWIWDDCLHTNAVCALELNTRACAVHSAEPTLPWHMAGQIRSRQKCSLWQSICFDEKLQTFVQSGQTRERKAEKIQIVCQHVQVHRNVDSNKASPPVPPPLLPPTVPAWSRWERPRWSSRPSPPPLPACPPCRRCPRRWPTAIIPRNPELGADTPGPS